MHFSDTFRLLLYTAPRTQAVDRDKERGAQAVRHRGGEGGNGLAGVGEWGRAAIGNVGQGEGRNVNDFCSVRAVDPLRGSGLLLGEGEDPEGSSRELNDALKTFVGLVRFEELFRNLCPAD